MEDFYEGDGLNLYAYCRNNPIVYYDSTGYMGQTNIKKYRSSNGRPTIPGIFEQKYTVPGYDGIIKKGAPKGKFVGYKNIKEPKTYYDPTQITDTEMVQAAKDAMRNGTLEGSDSRKVVGTTLLKGEEIKFVAYIKDGEFSTIYPTLRKEKTKKKGKEGKE